MRAEHISSISLFSLTLFPPSFWQLYDPRRSRSFTLIDLLAFVNSTVVPDYVRCAPSIARDATDEHDTICR